MGIQGRSACREVAAILPAVTYREGPAAKKRIRCRKHFLAYDPAVAPGCVLCKRPGPGGTGAGGTRLVLLTVIVLGASAALVGGTYAVIDALDPHAMPGEICRHDQRCLDGYDCLSRAHAGEPRADETGECIRRCTGRGDCAEGERCAGAGRRRHCLSAREPGELCDALVSCGDDAECLVLRSGPDEGRCRLRCRDTGASPCPAGHTCTRVLGNPMDPSTGSFCFEEAAP